MKTTESRTHKPDPNNVSLTRRWLCSSFRFVRLDHDIHNFGRSLNELSIWGVVHLDPQFRLGGRLPCAQVSSVHPPLCHAQWTPSEPFLIQQFSNFVPRRNVCKGTISSSGRTWQRKCAPTNIDVDIARLSGIGLLSALRTRSHSIHSASRKIDSIPSLVSIPFCTVHNASMRVINTRSFVPKPSTPLSCRTAFLGIHFQTFSLILYDTERPPSI